MPDKEGENNLSFFPQTSEKSAQTEESEGILSIDALAESAKKILEADQKDYENGEDKTLVGICSLESFSNKNFSHFFCIKKEEPENIEAIPVAP